MRLVEIGIGQQSLLVVAQGGFEGKGRERERVVENFEGGVVAGVGFILRIVGGLRRKERI